MRRQMLSRKIVRRRRRPGEIATARAAIHNHCLECCGYSGREVHDCTGPGCWLWPYRLGKEGTLDTRQPAPGMPADAGVDETPAMQV